MHVGPALGQSRCPVEHVGLVLSGTATAAFDDGRVIELVRAMCSTFRRSRTTAGSSATSPTCRCTFWAQRITPGRSEPLVGSHGVHGAHRRTLTLHS